MCLARSSGVALVDDEPGFPVQSIVAKHFLSADLICWQSLPLCGNCRFTYTNEARNNVPGLFSQINPALQVKEHVRNDTVNHFLRYSAVFCKFRPACCCFAYLLNDF